MLSRLQREDGEAALRNARTLPTGRTARRSKAIRAMAGNGTGRLANAASGYHFVGFSTSTRLSTGSRGGATGCTRFYTWNGGSHPLGAHSRVSQYGRHCNPGPVGRTRPLGDGHANSRQSRNHRSGYHDNSGVCHLELVKRNRIHPDQLVWRTQGWHGGSSLPKGEGATGKARGTGRRSIELVQVGRGRGRGIVELIRVGGRCSYPE